MIVIFSYTGIPFIIEDIKKGGTKIFSQNKCLVSYCKKNALSAFDDQGNIIEESAYCLDHEPNPGSVKDKIFDYVSKHDKIVGLNASGVIFNDINFSNKQFFGCTFTHCTFTNIHSNNTKMRMCVFDYAVFNDCNLVNSHSLFTSFSQCTFTHTLFTSSDMIQNNFNGIKSYQSSFDDSDLFNCRFRKSSLIDTSFRNCNLKKCNFIDSYRSNVSFKMSNTREAIFDELGTGLETGFAQDTSLLSNSSPAGGK